MRALDRLEDDHARLNVLVPLLLGLVAVGRPLARALDRAAAARAVGPERRPAQEAVVFALLGCVSFTRNLEARLARFAADAPPPEVHEGEPADPRAPGPTLRELLR